MNPVNRRSFIRTSAQVAAGVAAATSVSGRARGANERIRVANVGIRGQGSYHTKRFMQLGDKGHAVDVVALCDVDEQILGKRADELTALRDQKPATFVDVRKLLEDKSIDAISIATPNHWHALATIWACQAGKDVYVEKPASWSIWEGRKMVEAARKYKRMVAVGTHHRANPTIRDAARQLRGGVIGNVYMSRALVFRRRESIGFKPAGQPPKHLHFDLWVGPAPMESYHENLVHYNWHWFWNFGNGEIGNNGIHMMDMCRFAADLGVPVKVSSHGGRFCYTDQAETPNTQIATLTFGDGTLLVCDVRNRYTNKEEGGTPTLFYGSEGYMANWKANHGFGGKPFGGGQDVSLPELPGKGEADNYENFLNVIRNRRSEDLNTEILDGHRSAICFHLANISYRLGGRTLAFDPKAERFVGDGANEANGFLKRAYREPFVIPETV